jgi:hypothetical protein
MKLDPCCYESFEIGPVRVTVGEDYSTAWLALDYQIGDWTYCGEPFEGETLEDAKSQAAQRCITMFAEWADEAKKIIGEHPCSI